MNIRLKPLGAALALAVASVGAQAQLILTNGGFESPVLGSGWTTTGGVHFALLSSYNVPSIVPNAPGAAFTDSTVAFFGGRQLQGGSLTQTLNTTVGQLYSVAFNYGVIGSTLNPQSLLAVAVGQGTPAFIANVPGTNNYANLFRSYNFTFTATSANTLLAFTDLSGSSINADGVLDNVSVTAVPEPGTYALMLAGLGLVVWMARRRGAVGGQRAEPMPA